MKGRELRLKMRRDMAINSDEKRDILAALMVVQDSKCYYCKAIVFIGTIEQRINKDSYPDIATIEHLLPNDHPQRNHKENLAMACNKCNNERSKIVIKNK